MSLVDLPYRAQLDDRGSPIVVYFDPDLYEDPSRTIYPGELVFTDTTAEQWEGADGVKHLRVFSNANCFRPGKIYAVVGVSITYLRLNTPFHITDALFTATIDGIITLICPEHQLTHATVGDYVCVNWKPSPQRFALHHESHNIPIFSFRKRVVIDNDSYESFRTLLETLGDDETITAVFKGKFDFSSTTPSLVDRTNLMDSIGRVISIDREDNNFRISLLL